jgi:hypothetical protein
MFKLKKSIAYVLFLILVSIFIAPPAKATTTNFTVPSGEQVIKSTNLAVEDHVLIKFTVVGLPDNSINFSIVYPNGTVKDFGMEGDFHYSFICDAEGEYIMHFSNPSSGEKLVALDYEVERYIFGIPQMLFLVMVIAVICVAAVAVFIFLGKPR